MKKLLIGLGSLVLIAAAIVLVGGFVLLKTMDLEKIKAEVISAVKEKTGRDLVLGDLGIAMGFSPTISVHNVTLSNPSWAKSPYLVQLKEASFSFDIKPLLSKQLKINSVMVDGLDTALESSKKGEKSWDMQMKPKEAAQTSKEAASSNFSVAFADIDGKDIRVNYLDQATGKKESVVLSKIKLSGDPKLSLSATAERGDGTYELTAEAESLDKVLAGAPLDIAFNGKSSKSDAAIALKGIAKNVTTNASFGGNIEAHAASLADFGAFSGSSLPTSEPISLKSGIDATATRINLSKLDAAIGDKKGTGNLSADLSGKKPYVKGALNLPSLTLGNASGDGSSAAAGTSTPDNGGRVIPNIAFPTDQLNAVNADLKLTVGTLILPGQTLQNIDATVALKDGTLSVSPFSFALEGAPVTGSMMLSAAGTSLDINGKAVPISALAKEAPVKGGAATFNMKVAGQGKDLHSVLSSLNGQTSFYVKDATYQLKHQGAAALFKTLNGGKSGNDVALSCAAGTFTIAQGIASTNAVVADTSAVRVDGNGSINLAQEKWKMLLTPTPKAVGLSELAIPLRVGGTFSNPSVVPDPAGTAVAAAQLGLGLATKGSPAGLLGSALFSQLKPAAGDEAMKNSPCFSAPPQGSGAKPAATQPNIKDIIPTNKKELGNTLKNLKLF